MCSEVDARGLSCPEPVLMVTRELDNMSSGILRVKVSNVAAGEKITRLAKSKGWQVEVTNEGEDIVLTLRK
jgi:tRNA 2-thiouridine synthesizing protein A